jgi:DNA-binding response OmpR family regulator
MADDRFENLMKALCVMAARRGDLSDRVDAAIFEINDYLARSLDGEGELERVRVLIRAGAEMAEEQHPTDVPFWTTVQEYLSPFEH